MLLANLVKHKCLAREVAIVTDGVLHTAQSLRTVGRSLKANTRSGRDRETDQFPAASKEGVLLLALSRRGGATLVVCRGTGTRSQGKDRCHDLALDASVQDRGLVAGTARIVRSQRDRVLLAADPGLLI